MQYKEAEVGEVVYFWFAANLTTGAAGDGATPLYDVRLAGAASDAAPTASGTPTLLSHANYSDGLHEIAIDSTGYAAGEYAVFCTLTISTVNPAGFCGSFRLKAAGASIHSATTRVLLALPAAAAGANGGLPTTNGTKVSQTVDLTSGQTIKADVDTIKTQAVTCAAGVTILANVGAAGAPGAANGVPTTNGTKLNQTVDLTAGQSIAASSVPAVTLANGAHGGAAATLQLGGAGGLTGAVTGSLSGSVGSVTGAVGSVTGAVGSVTGAVGSVTGAVGSVTAGVTLANGAHGGAAATITLQTPIAASIASAPDSAGVSTLLTRVPDTISLAAINAEVDGALNTAIPGVPTANSINERIAAIDDLTQASGGGDLAALKTTVGAAGAGLTSIPDSAGVTTLLARLGAWTGTGVNTLLGAFKALLSKAATIPTDIGGTFDPATDSTEAIRDTAPLGTAMRGTDSAALAATALSDAVWTNAKAAFLDEAISAAKTLTAAERNSIADAHLDRTDGIETGVTPRQAHRLEVASAAGVTSGMATATPLLKNPAGTKTRVTATADADGNRSVITLTDLT